MKKFFFIVVASVMMANLTMAQDYYWPLKADLKDTKGNLVGTNQGVQFNNDAVRGSVAYFDGNSYAKLPSFIKGNTEITVAVWFRMDEVRPWSRIYNFGKGDQTEPKDVMMVVPVNGAGDPTKSWFRFTLTNAGPWLDADVDTLVAKVTTNKWYHTVMIIKADSVIGYFDNKVIIEEEFARDLTTMDDTENALGKSFWPDAMWKGALSDLRVYTKALTKQEVKALYNETNLNPTGVTKFSSSADAASVYSMDKSIKVQLKVPAQNAMVSVYSIAGNLITNQPISRISNTKFITGIYLVKVTGSGIAYTTKVVVK